MKEEGYPGLLRKLGSGLVLLGALCGRCSLPSRMPASVSLVPLLGSPPDDKGAPTSLSSRLVTIEPRTHLDLDLDLRYS